MQFMASGMLLNVFAAMDLPRIKEQLGEALTGLPGTALTAPSIGQGGVQSEHEVSG